MKRKRTYQDFYLLSGPNDIYEDKKKNLKTLLEIYQKDFEEKKNQKEKKYYKNREGKAKSWIAQIYKKEMAELEDVLGINVGLSRESP